MAKPKLVRREDWLQRLEIYLAETAREPFVWGQHDCMLDVSAMIGAMTGHDPAKAYRGKYTDRASGLALARSLGLKDHLEGLSQGLEQIPTGHADVGDLVELPGHTAGIVQGRYIWAMAEQGRALVDYGAAKRAWHIPHKGETK